MIVVAMLGDSWRLESGFLGVLVTYLRAVNVGPTSKVTLAQPNILMFGQH